MTAQDLAVESSVPEPPIFQWESLWRSARVFARACADNYSVQDAAFFYLHAGASVELGVKAALCRVSPVLLIEGGSKFSDHALLSLVGHPVRPAPSAGKQGRRVFTVSFEAAIRRFLLLHGEGSLGVQASDIESLKNARDVTAHGGDVAVVEAETLLRILVTLARVHDALAPLLDTTPEEFWGASHGLVRKASEEHHSRAQHQVETLLRAANSRFQDQYGDLDPDALGAIQMQAAERLQLSARTGYRKCPVCGSAGISQERPAKKRVSKRGPAQSERGWTAVDFRCPVCKLYLPNEDLVGLAEGFDPWESYGADELSIDFWVEDVGLDNLDDEDHAELVRLGYRLGDD